MKKDYHIHTKYSYDSCIDADTLLIDAIANGYSDIAITEHLDLLPQELSLYGLPSLNQYREYIRALQLKHPSIGLQMGIEIGDFHQVREFATNLISGFDFFPILGSVHFLSDHTNVAIPMPNKLTTHQVLDYYEQNLSLVSECDIDVLAHLGVYKRYYPEAPDESFALSLIKEVFRKMISKGIALELNFSAYRKPYKSILPDPGYLKLYSEMGGYLFTIGSDAHHIDHFDKHYHHAISYLPEGAQLL
ncbi:MAG TPA: histidinol-phosphatase HisJ family protein [Candidatus Cloacimonadota bacterium]|nr:histidinol-phosphatase HisJ family protein [Candidatus Cloacimonadota bacterium]